MTTNRTTTASIATNLVSAPAHEHEIGVLQVWLRLLTCTTLIENQVSSRLRTQFETTLPRFDLMAQLARYPEGLTMSDLSQRMMVSGGNITSITDNLERDYFVERITQPGDRRVKLVRLTPKGHLAFDAMAKTHHTWIDEWLNGLSSQEQQLLHSLLGKLKQHVQTSIP